MIGTLLVDGGGGGGGEDIRNALDKNMKAVKYKCT